MVKGYSPQKGLGPGVGGLRGLPRTESGLEDADAPEWRLVAVTLHNTTDKLSVTALCARTWPVSERPSV